MRQYLAEGYTGSFPFIVDRSKPIVQENLENGTSVWRIPGRFSEVDKVNGNNRRYSRKVWEKNLNPESTLQQLITDNAAFGQLEHPKDGQMTLDSPISHAVTKASMQEDGIIIGEITILDLGENSPGRKLKGLVEFGYNPRVSSRGFGSLLKASDGVDDVQEDFVCEGWDVVIKPSFPKAILTPARQNGAKELSTDVAPAPGKEDNVIVTTEATKAITEETVAEAFACGETTCPSCGKKGRYSMQGDKVKPCEHCGKPLKKEDQKEETKENLEQQPAGEPTPAETAPTASAPSAAAPAPTTTITENTMTIQDIRNRIAALKGVDTSKLQPREFAEGVAQMGSLHQDVANYVAEDMKRSYEGTKLHQEVESIEQAWADSQAAPAKTAAKLKEDRNKVLHVCKSVVETALKYKKVIAEQLKTQASHEKLIEELTTNGTGWMDLANKRKEQRDFVAKKYQVACEALMLMSQRYKDDLTTVGRHALNLEFKEALEAKPELQKALQEAKLPQDILAIREQLEGKPEETPAAETPANPEAAKEETPDAVKESKPATAAAAQVTESKPSAAAEPVTEEEETPRNPKMISEAAEIAKRLSLASAK
jgi:hypothetical protein